MINRPQTTPRINVMCYNLCFPSDKHHNESEGWTLRKGRRGINCTITTDCSQSKYDLQYDSNCSLG